MALVEHLWFLCWGQQRSPKSETSPAGRRQTPCSAALEIFQFLPEPQGLKIQINPHPWGHFAQHQKAGEPCRAFQVPPNLFFKGIPPSARQIPPFCQLHSEFLVSKQSQCILFKNCHQGKPSDLGARWIHNTSDNFLFLQSLISGCVAHRADTRSLVCTYILI